MLQQIAIEQSVSSVQLPTGVRLSFVEQGDKSGESMIMLHGYTDSSHSYSLVLPLLSPRYHVFALDQRGHGDSSKDAHEHTIQAMADDVIAFMNVKGIDKAILVGHSMGSMVAQMVAIQHPDRLSRLVLVDSFPIGGTEAVREMNEFVQTFVDPVDPAFAREFQESTVFRSVPHEFFEKVIDESLKVPAHVWRQALASCVQFDLTADLPKIKAPTYIQWGDQDQVTSWDDQQIFVRFIPNATLRVYEQTGHDPHWEQPEVFVQDLEAFLQQTRPQ